MMALHDTFRNSLLALGVIASLGCAGFFSRASARPDDSTKDVIGAIDGAAISVSGPMTVDVIAGQAKTILRSGSEVRVKSGTAHIDLVEGGQLIICGPAHFSILKSGGAITLALDSGVVHAHVNSEPVLTIYTPQIQAKPIAVGDAAEDIFVGLDVAGALCVRANRGAVRIEQQLTGQSIIVPQGGEVSLGNGQLEGLRNTPGRCLCELAPADLARPEISRLATAEEVGQSAGETKQNAPETRPGAADAPSKERQEPIYQVFMPPLRFDASAKIQPEPDPRMILLVRRIRVRPTLIFQGRVKGETIATQAAPASPNPVVVQNKPAVPAKTQNDSVLNRVRKFFHNLWSASS